MIEMMVIKEHLTVIILYKYKRKRWFVGMAINCGIANQLPVIAICSDRLLVQYALITIDKLLTRFKIQKLILTNYFFIYRTMMNTTPKNYIYKIFWFIFPPL